MKYFCLVWEQHCIVLYQILHFVALCHGTVTHPEATVMILILEAGVTIRDTKNPSWSNIIITPIAIGLLFSHPNDIPRGLFTSRCTRC